MVLLAAWLARHSPQTCLVYSTLSVSVMSSTSSSSQHFVLDRVKKDGGGKQQHGDSTSVALLHYYFNLVHGYLYYLSVLITQKKFWNTSIAFRL